MINSYRILFARGSIFNYNMLEKGSIFVYRKQSNIQKVALCEDWKRGMLNQIEIDKVKQKQSSQFYAGKLSRQLKDTDTKLDKLVNSFLEGIIEKEIYLKTKDELIRTKTDLLQKKDSFRRKGDNRLQPLKEWIIEASSVDKIVDDARMGASSKNMEEIKLFFEKIGSNRRLMDREIVFDWKEPWNLLAFSDDDLLGAYPDYARSAREKFSKNQQSSMWWLRLLLKRTYFENLLAA